MYPDMPHTILYAEDDVNDVALVQVAVEESHRPIDFHFVSDGADAIAYLRNEGPFSNPELSPRPDLIFLDINMPRRSGFDVLAWIRARERFAHIPVVIVSSSSQQTDVTKAYMLGANAYLVKPSAFAQMKDIFTRSTDFFLFPNSPKSTGPTKQPGRTIIH
jgi:CheY-like chemotaxis protein